jgi:hypothetical protein
MIAFMQSIGTAIMKVIAAIAWRLRPRMDAVPGRNALRRDIGLEARPAPRREWQDYV